MSFNVCAFTFHLPFPLRLPEKGFRLEVDNSQFCLVRIRACLGKTEFLTERALTDQQVLSRSDNLLVRVSTRSGSGSKMEALDVIADKDGQTLKWFADWGYTIADVVIGVPPSENVQGYLEQASDTLSRFLLGYRLFFQDHSIPNLRVEDIPVIEIRSGTCTEDEAGQFSIALGNFQPRYQWEDIGKHIKPVLADERNAAFAEWVRGGIHIAEYERLLLVSTEWSSVYKDYPSSVIFCQSAFEVFVSDFVGRRAAASGIAQLPLERKAKGKAVLRPVSEALARSRLKYILKTMVPLVSKSGMITGAKEYSDWDTHAYRIRNEVVHAGRRNVSAQDADRAFDSVVALIGRLEGLP